MVSSLRAIEDKKYNLKNTLLILIYIWYKVYDTLYHIYIYIYIYIIYIYDIKVKNTKL